MKTTNLLFLLILLSYSCNQKPSIEKAAILPILEKHWEPYSSTFSSEDVGVATIATNKRGQQYYGTYGFQKDFSMSQRFRSASVTKTFTVAAILKLKDEGKLDINDLIIDTIPGKNTTYFPTEPDYKIPYRNEITIVDLMSHYAGVFDVTNIDIPDTVDAPYAGTRYIDYQNQLANGLHKFTKDELIKVVVTHQLSLYEPGARFHYSNTGYGMLGVIIERVSGQPLDQYLQKAFLDPLEMKNTTFAIEPELNFLSNPYHHYTHVENELLMDVEDNISSAQAEGNIITSMEDLLIWCDNLYQPGRILTQSSIDAMVDLTETNDPLVLYGLGCEGYPEELGYGHSGARLGTLVVMRHDPVTGTSMIARSNLLDFNSMEEFIAENEILYDILRDVKEAVK